MKQVISIHVGQAGVQMGSACWQLFCQQHGLNAKGMPDQDNPNGSRFGHNETFFQELPSGSFRPRSVFVDLEPNIIDELRTGQQRQLFNSDQLINGKEDAANIYGRGRWTNGRRMLSPCMDIIRKEFEKCDHAQGVMLYSALGGGTGSGMSENILQRLHDQVRSKQKVVAMSVVPSPKMGTFPVQAYNAVLSSTGMLQFSDVKVFMQNQSLYRMCEHLGIESPSFAEIDRLIARVASSLTSSMRLGGSLNTSLDDFATNMVPYRKIQYLLASLTLHSPAERLIQHSTVSQITDQCFSNNNFMTECSPEQSQYISCALNYRGDFNPVQLIKTAASLRYRPYVNFVDYSPTGFKVGLSPLPASNIRPRGQCVLFANNTAMKDIFSGIGHKFDSLYRMRSFIFWFLGQGMQQGEFSQNREQMAYLEKEYEEVGRQTVEYDDEQEAGG